MHIPIRRLALAALPLLAACSQNATQQTSAPAAATSAAALLTPGPWRGELAIQGQQLPFLFEVKTEAGKPVVYLINKGLNGEERLRCDEIAAAGDSVTIRLHVFDAALVVRADGKDKLKGTWVKYDAKTSYRVPLVATAGAQALFSPNYTKPMSLRKKINGEWKTADPNPVNGDWKVTFTDENKSQYQAVGVFKQSGTELNGTFLTTTGDYRYLSGQVIGDELRLSTFDGNHAFLFTGQTDFHVMFPIVYGGSFYSGKRGYETWTAIRKDGEAKLPDADTLTYLRKGESRLNFKFPSIQPGGSISPTDAKYRGKVVVLQILGSWCPNCMDETRFLAPWYQQNKQRGVEVIGLGYERSPDYAQAAERLRLMKERLGVGYDLVVAGTSNKDSVAKSLPQLAKFLAFPTTIFLDRKGMVRSIHTGFAGPGTGQYYEEEKAHFNRTVDKLLAE